MQCEDRKDLWMLYAAGQLDPGEQEALRKHILTGCPSCSCAFAEAEATVAQLALAVVPIPPPPAAFDRIIAVIHNTPPIRGVRRRWPRLAGPACAAVLAVALTSVAWLYLTQDARRFWRSSNLVTVVLTSKTQPAAKGQVWWDHDSRQWRISVINLAPTAEGREYELWLIPVDGKPIRSQTFNVRAGKRSTIVVPVPSEIGTTAVAAITDEPLGGSDQPTGNIHLAGTFK